MRSNKNKKQRKVIDIEAIEVGDVVRTWNEDKEFLVLSEVDDVFSERGEMVITVEEYTRSIKFNEIFEHFKTVK